MGRHHNRFARTGKPVVAPEIVVRQRYSGVTGDGGGGRPRASARVGQIPRCHRPRRRKSRISEAFGIDQDARFAFAGSKGSYKRRPPDAPPGQGWVQTEEHFVGRSSGDTLNVWFHPRSDERIHVRATAIGGRSS
jgi:hypothetical protein